LADGLDRDSLLAPQNNLNPAYPSVTPASFGTPQDLVARANAKNADVALKQNFVWLLQNALLTNGGQLM
jgi:hypothetical protein